MLALSRILHMLCSGSRVAYFGSSTVSFVRVRLSPKSVHCKASDNGYIYFNIPVVSYLARAVRTV